MVGSIKIFVPCRFNGYCRGKNKAEGSIEGSGTSSRKLANSDFRAKAAPEVISKEEAKMKEFQKNIQLLEGALKKLQKF